MILSCATEPTPSRFTASIEISENGQRVLTGVIYVHGWKYRMDLLQENERISILADKESDWTWLLMPDKKMCTYISADDPENISSNPFQGLRYLRSKYDQEPAENDTISGYDCVGYAIKNDGHKVMSYWLAAELHFPLKIIEHSTSDITTELSAIVEGEIDDSLFTVPDDYTILAQRWKP
jgi:hypothetical protein